LFTDNQIADPANINELLTRHCTLWRGTGLNLGLKESLLDSIEHDHKAQRKCFDITLKMWLQKDQDKATWGVLELAITNANRAELSYGKLLKCKFSVIFTNWDFYYSKLQVCNMYVDTHILPVSSDVYYMYIWACV